MVAAQHVSFLIADFSGDELGDDATALCVDWHGGPPRDRATASGADRLGS